MTRTAFLAEYRAALVARYSWTNDAAKLDRFMAGVAETLAGGKTWNHDGAAVTAAWRAIGGKGNPTLSALRSLP